MAEDKSETGDFASILGPMERTIAEGLARRGDAPVLSRDEQLRNNRYLPDDAELTKLGIELPVLEVLPADGPLPPEKPLGDGASRR